MGPGAELGAAGAEADASSTTSPPYSTHKVVAERKMGEFLAATVNQGMKVVMDLILTYQVNQGMKNKIAAPVPCNTGAALPTTTRTLSRRQLQYTTARDSPSTATWP